MSDKKYNITPQDIQIAERLKGIFEKRKKEAKAQGMKFSQETVALACGWTQGAVGQYLNAKIPLNFSAASKLANALNASISDFAPSLASQIAVAPIHPRDGQTLESLDIRPVIDMDEGKLEDDEFEYPHFHEVFVSGGSNELPILEASSEPSRLKKSIARKAGASMTHSFSFNLEGHSMKSKILDGACCTADASKKQIKDGKIYVFRHGVMRRTKYLFNRPDGGLLVRSENREDFPDEIIKGEEMGDVEILGWVYHWCNTETW